MDQSHKWGRSSFLSRLIDKQVGKIKAANAFKYLLKIRRIIDERIRVNGVDVIRNMERTARPRWRRHRDTVFVDAFGINQTRTSIMGEMKGIF